MIFDWYSETREQSRAQATKIQALSLSLSPLLQLKMETMILLGESIRGEVKADFSMVPLAVDEAEELETVEDDDDEDEEVGEPAEVAAGDVDEDEVEAVEMADESDELLSDNCDEPIVRPCSLSCCCWFESCACCWCCGEDDCWSLLLLLLL